MLFFRQKDLQALKTYIPLNEMSLQSLPLYLFDTKMNLKRAGKKSKRLVPQKGGPSRLTSTSCSTFYIMKFAPVLWELRHIGTDTPWKSH